MQFYESYTRSRYGKENYTYFMEIILESPSLFFLTRTKSITSVQYANRSFANFYVGTGYRQMSNLKFMSQDKLVVIA